MSTSIKVSVIVIHSVAIWLKSGSRWLAADAAREQHHRFINSCPLCLVTSNIISKVHV
jgi:hypothetical protein